MSAKAASNRRTPEEIIHAWHRMPHSSTQCTVPAAASSSSLTEPSTKPPSNFGEIPINGNFSSSISISGSTAASRSNNLDRRASREASIRPNTPVSNRNTERAVSFDKIFQDPLHVDRLLQHQLLRDEVIVGFLRNEAQTANSRRLPQEGRRSGKGSKGNGYRKLIFNSKNPDRLRIFLAAAFIRDQLSAMVQVSVVPGFVFKKLVSPRSRLFRSFAEKLKNELPALFQGVTGQSLQGLFTNLLFETRRLVAFQKSVEEAGRDPWTLTKFAQIAVDILELDRAIYKRLQLQVEGNGRQADDAMEELEEEEVIEGVDARMDENEEDEERLDTQRQGVEEQDDGNYEEVMDSGFVRRFPENDIITKPDTFENDDGQRTVELIQDCNRFEMYHRQHRHHHHHHLHNSSIDYDSTTPRPPRRFEGKPESATTPHYQPTGTKRVASEESQPFQRRQRTGYAHSNKGRGSDNGYFERSNSVRLGMMPASVTEDLSETVDLQSNFIQELSDMVASLKKELVHMQREQRRREYELEGKLGEMNNKLDFLRKEY
ncbi:hypothetical protein BG015_009776 [Linnemannia schmuckeri]|uniref:Uncharacterized protein n=1 Tax=Linnemannia schmuckeri TaxID=64567 RepID=A0A9P5RYJ1_9FUNG|nr:hypothetical protein BG015_009776 [Linnemannia schmuckeri]